MFINNSKRNPGPKGAQRECFCNLFPIEGSSYSKSEPQLQMPANRNRIHSERLPEYSKKVSISDFKKRAEEALLKSKQEKPKLSSSMVNLSSVTQHWQRRTSGP